MVILILKMLTLGNFLGFVIFGCFIGNSYALYFQRTETHDLPFDDWIVSSDNEIANIFSDPRFKSSIRNIDVGGEFIDIFTVTYSLNDKFLNATIVFGSDIRHLKNQSNFSYGAWLDLDNNKETGRDGFDYAVTMKMKNGTIYRELKEVFLGGIVKQRALDTFPSMNTTTAHTADLFLDLSEVNNPKRFTAKFFVSNNITRNDLKYKISDESPLVVIPPFDVKLNANPTFFDIYPGDSKTVEWSVNSSSRITGVTTMYLQDTPVSIMFPFLPDRGLDTVTRNYLNINCYSSLANSSLIQKAFKNIMESGGYSTRNFTSSNLMNEPSGNVLSFGVGQIDGINITRSPTLDNFSHFDTYYHAVDVKALENASSGFTYLTLRTNLFDKKIDYSPADFYSDSSVLDNNAFYSCITRYDPTNIGYGEIDIGINVLPPKDSFKKINDFLENYDTLLILFGALLTGGLVGKVIQKSIGTVIQKTRRYLNQRRKTNN